MAETPNPTRLFEIATGYRPAKILLTAFEFGLFTLLGNGSMSTFQICNELALHPESARDFLDALVAMEVLDREGDGDHAQYRNNAVTATYLDQSSPDYLGGYLEFQASRMYPMWNSLSHTLKTGTSYENVTSPGALHFESEYYSDREKSEQFMDAMAGLNTPVFHALADAFDFSDYETVADVGGGTGRLSIILSQRFPHLRCINFDLPVVEQIATKTIAGAGMSDRISVVSGNFFSDPLPAADVVVLSQILHDWNLERKLDLIRSAYQALSPGGVLIVIEFLIDDARRKNLTGLINSLVMRLEFGDSFNFSGADFEGWCRTTGFRDNRILPLREPISAALAYK